MNIMNSSSPRRLSIVSSISYVMLTIFYPSVEQHNMHDITSDFACLKVSALEKASRISGSVRRVTIGPDSILIPDCGEENENENENIENEPDNRIVRVVRSEATPPNPKISSRTTITFSIKKILLENEIQRREDVRVRIDTIYSFSFIQG